MSLNSNKALVSVFVALLCMTLYIFVDIMHLPRELPDPTYSTWSPWSACSATCDEGKKTRKRTCILPTKNDDRTCQRLGSAEESLPCNYRACPIDGGFGPWSEHTPCSKKCDSGTQSRRRKCDSPAPQNGGRFCIGPEEETRECNIFGCVVDGGYNEWENWGGCTGTCGTRKRIRKCEKPVPRNGGKDCSSLGKAEEEEKCNKEACEREEKKKKAEEEKKKKEEEEMKKKNETESKKKKEEETKKKKEEEEKKKKEEETKKKKEEEEKKKKEEETKKKKEEEEKKKKEEETKKKKEEEEKKKKEEEAKKKKEEEEKKKKEEKKNR